MWFTLGFCLFLKKAYFSIHFEHFRQQLTLCLLAPSCSFLYADYIYRGYRLPVGANVRKPNTQKGMRII